MGAGQHRKETLAQIELEIAECRGRISEIQEDAKRRVGIVDGQIERLRGAARALREPLPKAEGRRPRRQAGPRNVETVYETLRRSCGGSGTQADVVHATGINDGTASYAMRALVNDGRVERVGEGRGALYRVVEPDSVRVRPR